ncbi:MAG: DNA-directed RNA polymerase subunit omega [Clostridia bacterium]|nr:DNA-directed RNA polymerase subunit omega [Clostridia bacterium]
MSFFDNEIKVKDFNPDLKELLKSDQLEGRISRYSLVTATAKLAREISDEANEMGEIITDKPVSMALAEFLDGNYEIVEPEEIQNI